MGEEWYVVRSGFIGVCCAEIGGRGVVQQINRQLTKGTQSRLNASIIKIIIITISIFCSLT